MYSASIMIKIRFYPLFLVLLGIVSVSGVAYALHESNWLSIVQQRLELEQKTVDVFLKGVQPDDKKTALDNAVLFYKNKFETLYKELMVIFQENDDWKELREYLVENSKILDVKYDQLRRSYAAQVSSKSKITDNALEKYQADVSSYYENMMEVLKKVVTDGQAKEVELRKVEMKQLRQQERRKKLEEQSSVWNEVE